MLSRSPIEASMSPAGPPVHRRCALPRAIRYCCVMVMSPPASRALNCVEISFGPPAAVVAAGAATAR